MRLLQEDSRTPRSSPPRRGGGVSLFNGQQFSGSLKVYLLFPFILAPSGSLWLPCLLPSVAVEYRGGRGAAADRVREPGTDAVMEAGRAHHPNQQGTNFMLSFYGLHGSVTPFGFLALHAALCHSSHCVSAVHSIGPACALTSRHPCRPHLPLLCGPPHHPVISPLPEDRHLTSP